MFQHRSDSPAVVYIHLAAKCLNIEFFHIIYFFFVRSLRALNVRCVLNFVYCFCAFAISSGITATGCVVYVVPKIASVVATITLILSFFAMIYPFVIFSLYVYV